MSGGRVQPIVYQSHYARWVPVPLCTSPGVHQSHYAPVPLCTSPFVYQSHCVPVPLCTSPNVLIKQGDLYVDAVMLAKKRTAQQFEN